MGMHITKGIAVCIAAIVLLSSIIVVQFIQNERLQVMVNKTNQEPTINLPDPTNITDVERDCNALGYSLDQIPFALRYDTQISNYSSFMRHASSSKAIYYLNDSEEEDNSNSSGVIYKIPYEMYTRDGGLTLQYIWYAPYIQVRPKAGIVSSNGYKNETTFIAYVDVKVRNFGSDGNITVRSWIGYSSNVYGTNATKLLPLRDVGQLIPAQNFQTEEKTFYLPNNTSEIVHFTLDYSLRTTIPNVYLVTVSP
jgi:hypothetical protein